MRRNWLSPVPASATEDTEEQTLGKQLLWFFGIALLSASIVIVSAYILRSALLL